MAKATTCRSGTGEIDVAEALRRREGLQPGNPSLDFVCVECGHPVRPHRAGGAGAAHFEHLSRNPQCERSDPARS